MSSLLPRQVAPAMLCAAAALTSGPAAQEVSRPAEKITYKAVGDVKLQLHVFRPEPRAEHGPRSAIVFFFGGGWNGGSPRQFYPHCEHLARRGMVAISAEYRVKRRHGTTPFDCVRDGKSAVRFVRANAAKLGIDPNRIAAGGGSAGGHVAAAVATVTGLDDEADESEVSPRPDALVLFNPVYDNGPDGYGYERVGARFREISPRHNIRKGMPPTMVFLGSEDRLVSVATAKSFQKAMRDVGSRSELLIYPGQKHGFFNLGRGDGSSYRATVLEMEWFLESLELLPRTRNIRVPTSDEVEELKAELLVRGERDQAVRGGGPGKQLPAGDVDADNTAWLEKTVDTFGWPTISMVGKKAARAAFLLIQHADRRPELQARFLPLLEAGAARGEASKLAVAYLTDRVRVKERRPQVYGTQYHAKLDGQGRAVVENGNLVYLVPVVEDVTKLDARRKAAGLRPWRTYEARMAELHKREAVDSPRSWDGRLPVDVQSHR